ncbi:glycerol-3-phosphate acyltransferase 1, mitochondrial [Caerostris extrusa]|uniref:Glycerol-3-phosphate acyltransferase 1, mitochondrial n=1 Tax=Caerostris extrusa TaxID=172846 RepID=A0AAV4UNK3_CAEEX|nr:glycerol-3-phosphate acyltransferase 1, mitochondrial [Caerostris extrusa]
MQLHPIYEVFTMGYLMMTKEVYKVSLSEVSRRLAKLRESWKQVVKTEKIQKMSQKEQPARRRTGVVNGITPFQKNRNRKYTKRELSLPFLDSGNWFGSNDENSSDVDNLSRYLMGLFLSTIIFLNAEGGVLPGRYSSIYRQRLLSG